MKKKFFQTIAGITVLLWFTCVPLYAQERNLKSKVLVFIMPDSLELPVNEIGKLSLQRADIKSVALATTLSKIKATGIARAFPEWTNKDSIVTSYKGEQVQAPPFNRIFTLTFNSETEADSAISVLKQVSAVIFAEKHSEPVLDNDVHYINGTQWYLNNDGRNGGVAGADINAEGAWAIYTGNPNNIIAIIDNGVELTHDDLAGKTTGDASVGFSHGTQVAGVAAARALNTVGIRGVDWNAQILSKRIWSEDDEYLGDAVTAQKITDAVNEGANVLNQSSSSTSYSSTLALAYAYAYKMNRVSVATMGNTWTEEVRYPAALSNIIAVGATQNNDVVGLYSTRGSHIDVVAPGGINPYPNYDGRDIFSTTIGNGYAFTSGTSFSAPQVAGLASLLKGFNSYLYNDDIQQIIGLSADDRGVPGFDIEYGFGRINAGSALQLLLAPNELKQWTASGGTSVSSTSPYTTLIMGASGLATAVYIVKRHEVQKNISFTQSFCQIIGAWGRGVSTSGWRHASPNFGEGFCEIVPGTLTTTGATLRTFVYQVYSIGGSYLGYYPSSPANVTFAYSVLGVINPTLSGPTLICSSGTFTANNLPTGSSISWNSSWNITLPTDRTTNPIVGTANGNGLGWIQATINSTSCGSVTLPQYQVWVGPFDFPVVTGTAEVCPNTQYDYRTQPPLGLSIYDYSYSWTYPSGWYQNNIGANGIVLTTPSDYTSGAVEVSITNECGASNYAGRYVWSNPDCYEYYSISPNPASNEVRVTVNNKVSEIAETKSSVGISKVVRTKYTIQILDFYGSLLYSATKSGDSFTIPISNLKDGQYFVHITNGKNTTSLPLIVKH
jgi:hypothetical protein